MIIPSFLNQRNLVSGQFRVVYKRCSICQSLLCSKFHLLNMPERGNILWMSWILARASLNRIQRQKHIKNTKELQLSCSQIHLFPWMYPLLQKLSYSCSCPCSILCASLMWKNKSRGSMQLKQCADKNAQFRKERECDKFNKRCARLLY